jgi:hypothetical protein
MPISKSGQAGNSPSTRKIILFPPMLYDYRHLPRNCIKNRHLQRNPSHPLLGILPLIEEPVTAG